MVGMTRAHIADPHLVTKLAEGHEMRIRPCVGATHCMSGARPSCLHNPATGREMLLPSRIARSERPGRKVVVVGGGPAGLEAARVAAERGHAVELFEAATELGGQVLIGAQGPWRQDLRGIVDWRVAEIDRLGVTIHMNAMATSEDILNLGPDVVVIATGGVPDLDWIDGVEHCVSAWDVLTGHVPLGQNILVYDGSGRHPAPQAAVRAASAGSGATLVTIDAGICAELTYAERLTWKQHCYGLKIPMIFDHRLVGVKQFRNRLTVTLVNEVTLEEQIIATDQIVVEHGTRPVDELYPALRAHSANHGVTDIDALLSSQPQPRSIRPEAGFELHRVGDAVASRNIHTAVLDSLRLCMVM